MHAFVCVLPVNHHSAETFQRSPVAIILSVLPRDQKISKVEVLLHEEGDVDGSDRKEKPTLILLHLFDEGTISLDETQDQLKRQNTASPEICLWVLTLKTQSHPLLTRNLRLLLEIFTV